MFAYSYDDCLIISIFPTIWQWYIRDVKYDLQPVKIYHQTLSFSLNIKWIQLSFHKLITVAGLMVWAENHIYAEGGKLRVLVKLNG